MIKVVATGAHATVQDLGRVGHTASGIAQGGAADRAGLRLANRLVGNAEDAAAFEVLLGGAAFQFTRAATVAVTGAPCPVLIGNTAGPLHAPIWIPQGTVLRLQAPPQQLRTYLAVRGGLASEPVLGSRAVDESSGIGRALRPGDTIPIGTAPTDEWRPVDIAPQPAWPGDVVTLSAMGGPREDWFTDASRRQFETERYIVHADSNRVGVRLVGPALRRRERAELLSEPTLRGAVEVPTDGQPIIFGADHPSTCGYPVIAVLDPAAADLVAQCRPGQPVQFVLRRPTVTLIR